VTFKPRLLAVAGSTPPAEQGYVCQQEEAYRG
jgi:hypothetical protein